MPLGGLFGSGGNSGPKPQPLQNENKKEKREKSSSSSTKDSDKDGKRITVKINKKTYTTEKKLAEGGFAIVYLVSDKHNRYYALKRQLIKDDLRQLEACKTESQIVKNLSGHKNLISYIDNQLTLNKTGVYDYMLLTVYYKTNVLQLMNNRLLAKKWLTVGEILDIFCDMCEAVARLHHSKTPVIHRDLKVENVLIDERSGSEKHVYVLCDFGSATTKVLSRDTHTVDQIDEEIRRYTTLSYRAPEMVDFFSGVPIGTKSDIWALGVMLYKLCYFSLPFGESSLAIQNGTFTFPDSPPIPEEIKAIINFLLTSSAAHRPNIFQTSYLAFSAANKKCPVFNIQRSPRIELLEAVKIFRMRDRLGANYARALEKAINEAYSNTLGKALPTDLQTAANQDPKIYHDLDHSDTQLVHSSSSNNPFLQPLLVDEETQVVPTPIAPTAAYSEVINPSFLSSTAASTTTVNPRLRPKPTSTLGNQTTNARITAPPSPRTAGEQKPYFTSSTAFPKDSIDTFTAPTATPLSARQERQQPQLSASDNMKMSQISTESSKSAPDHNIFSDSFVLSSKPPASTVPSILTSDYPSIMSMPSSNLKSSAFKPYSLTNRSQTNQVSIFKQQHSNSSASNPFIDDNQTTESPSIMDDNAFGERFDELRRVKQRSTATPNTITTVKVTDKTPFMPDPKIIEIIQNDPFTSAPFYSHQIYKGKRDPARVG